MRFFKSIFVTSGTLAAIIGGQNVWAQRASSFEQEQSRGFAEVQVINGETFHEEFIFEGDRVILSARESDSDDAGGIVLIDGRITSSEASATKGYVTFDRMTVSNEQAIDLLFGSPLCSLEHAGQTYLPLADIQVMNLYFHPPADPMTSPGGGPERLSVALAEAHVSQMADRSCARIDGNRLTGLLIEGADRSSARIKGMSGTFDFPPAGNNALSARIEMNGFLSRGPDGHEQLRFDHFETGFSADQSLVRYFDRAYEENEIDTEDALAFISGSNADAFISVEGLYTVTDAMLSEDLKEQLGTHEGDIIQGNASLELKSVMDRIEIEGMLDMNGLLAGDINMAMLLASEPVTGSVIAAVDDSAIGKIASHLKLIGMNFNFEDQGLWQKFEDATGRTPASYVDTLEARAERLPAAAKVAEPVIAWLRESLTSGHGAVEMKPETPVGVPELVLAAMINPSSLGKLLQVEVD